MQLFSCKVMRSMVVVSTATFSFGVILQLPSVLSWLQPQLSTAFFSYLGLLLMLLSPLILGISALIFSVPYVSHKLDSCQH